MKVRDFILIVAIILCLVLATGCSQSTPEGSNGTVAVTPASPAPQAAGGKVTLGDLTATVKEAVAYARQNGKEKAIAAFNDPNGTFARNGIYIFAEDYDGTALAEPF